MVVDTFSLVSSVRPYVLCNCSKKTFVLCPITVLNDNEKLLIFKKKEIFLHNTIPNVAFENRNRVINYAPHQIRKSLIKR